jgi:hypothetical protein
VPSGRTEQQAQGPLRCGPRAPSRRATAADQGQGPATSARRRNLACWRTARVRRVEILPRQPAGRHQPAHIGGHHQGAMGLRTGPPADERRTRPRSLRGPILARPSPSCANDHDRLRLPPASSPRKQGGKKTHGPPPQPSLPAVRNAIVSLITRPLQRCPHCRRSLRRPQPKAKSAKVVLSGRDLNSRASSECRPIFPTPTN